MDASSVHVSLGLLSTLLLLLLDVCVLYSFVYVCCLRLCVCLPSSGVPMPSLQLQL